MKARIVIVDDDPIVLDTLDGFFCMKGYEVIACQKLTTCLAYQNNTPCPCTGKMRCADVLITDNLLNGDRGVDFLEYQIMSGCKMRPRNKAVISGSFSEADIERIENMGCFWFAKPFALSRIGDWVDELVRGMDGSRVLRDLG